MMMNAKILVTVMATIISGAGLTEAAAYLKFDGVDGEARTKEENYSGLRISFPGCNPKGVLGSFGSGEQVLATRVQSTSLLLGCI